MHKKYLTATNIFLLIFSLLLLSIFFRFLSNLSFPDPNIELHKGALVKLQPEDSLTQKFTATRGGLAKVEFLLRSPGIEFAKKDKVIMQLADENCQGSIRAGELRSSFLKSDNLYEFNFDKIKDSKDKTYCVMATFKPTKASAKALQFFTLSDEENQPFSVRPVYTNDSFWQNANELNQRISQYKPWFLKHYFLWFIMIGFVLLSISLIIILIV